MQRIQSTTLFGAALAGTLFLAAPLEGADGPRSDERSVEHLLNRAGFGASRADVARGVSMGLEALVDELLDRARGESLPYFVESLRKPERSMLAEMTPEDRSEKINEYRRRDKEQLTDYAGWWFDEMLSGESPLRERMVLFWHGHFTSSYRDVKDSRAMIRQNELFRRHAVGSFADLLHGVVRDPAMLTYLDNNSNKRGKPNENLARELLELFTLGEGQYTEEDVKEAARALTGSHSRDGEFVFRRAKHDGGKKEILGRKGRFDAEGLVDVLLANESCPRWIAGRLLSHFEGREPPAERVEAYGELLGQENYDVGAFLRALFLDPVFYSPEVVGQRVAGPVDFLVGTSKRLGIAPPGRLLAGASSLLGQRLFDPQNVKGWEGGESWITTSSFLRRGNLAGVLLGVVRLEDVLSSESESGADTMSMEAMGEGMDAEARERSTPPREKAMREMRRLKRDVRRPRIHLAARVHRGGVERDDEIVDFLLDELLAVDASSESREALIEFLAEDRERLGADDGELLEAGEAAEQVLRRLAHLVLSLPEAQLL